MLNEGLPTSIAFQRIRRLVADVRALSGRSSLARSPCRGARSRDTCDPGRAMDSPDTLSKTVMPAFRGIVREAGAIAMRYFQPGLRTSAQVWNKSGGSPVTEADMAVDAFLKTRLGELVPEAGWLSEETADDARRLGKTLVWIVDPID